MRLKDYFTKKVENLNAVNEIVEDIQVINKNLQAVGSDAHFELDFLSNEKYMLRFCTEKQEGETKRMSYGKTFKVSPLDEQGQSFVYDFIEKPKRSEEKDGCNHKMSFEELKQSVSDEIFSHIANADKVKLAKLYSDFGDTQKNIPSLNNDIS